MLVDEYLPGAHVLVNSVLDLTREIAERSVRA